MNEDSRTLDEVQADIDATVGQGSFPNDWTSRKAERPTPAFDAEWWFEREEVLERRVKAVVTTYRVGDVSLTTRVEFE